MHELIQLIKQYNLKALFINKTDNPFIQFFRYVFVGGAATVVDWTFLWLFYDVIGIYKYLSVAFSFLLGLLTNFCLSDRFVFSNVPETRSSANKFSVYLITGLIGLGLTELFMLLFDGLLGLHYMIAKIITTAIVLAWNFFSKKIALYK
jgi:putative flippase GtrA